MATVKLKHLNSFADFRTGKPKHYLRVPGHKAVRLHGEIGSPGFMSAYYAAINGVEAAPKVSRGQLGSVTATVLGYFQTAAFAAAADATKRARREALEPFAREHGDKRIATLRRIDIQCLIDAKASTPGMARRLLSSLSCLMDYAVATRLRDDNPCVGVKRPKLSKEGRLTWTEEHIAAFERCHPVGSMARLALALGLYTGQRLGDVIKLGPQNVRAGVIELCQQKTSKSLMVPIHAELERIIAATPSGHMVFLIGASGKPYTAHRFGHWFHDCCKQAGIPDGFTFHGLRKAAARRLAEAGCTVHEIAAITGHASLNEVERYTKAADQVRMARAAMQRVNG
jgi:integrase